MGQLPQGNAPPLLQGKDLFTAQLFPRESLWLVAAFSLMCAYLKTALLSTEHMPGGHLGLTRSIKKQRRSRSWSHAGGSLSLPVCLGADWSAVFLPRVLLLLADSFNTEIPNLQDLPDELK